MDGAGSDIFPAYALLRNTSDSPVSNKSSFLRLRGANRLSGPRVRKVGSLSKSGSQSLLRGTTAVWKSLSTRKPIKTFAPFEGAEIYSSVTAASCTRELGGRETSKFGIDSSYSWALVCRQSVEANLAFLGTCLRKS